MSGGTDSLAKGPLCARQCQPRGADTESRPATGWDATLCGGSASQLKPVATTVDADEKAEPSTVSQQTSHSGR